MSDYIPFKICPYCGSEMLEKLNELNEGMGIGDMSEGEFAEYMAGT